MDKQNHPVWDLVCMNSHDLDLIREQHDWLTSRKNSRPEAVAAKNAFALFHIPLRQFEDLWMRKAANGARFERAAFEEEDGSSLAHLKAFGTIRACFCGHDHINHYSCRTEGIDWVYRRGTHSQGREANHGQPRDRRLFVGIGARRWDALEGVTRASN